MRGLSIEDVVAGYGQGDILRGVNLEVVPGTITCVIGPNGAGKSTVLKVVSALLQPTRGVDPSRRPGDLGSNPPRRARSRRGARAPGAEPVPADDRVGQRADGRLHRSPVATPFERRSKRSPSGSRSCGSVDDARAGSLSGGEQKIVEIARAMMLDPRIVLMDEPSMGLDPKARRVVFETDRGAEHQGATIVLVEQNARSGLAIADRGAVMESGVVRLAGAAVDLLHDPEVARLYLGSAARSWIARASFNHLTPTPHRDSVRDHARTVRLIGNPTAKWSGTVPDCPLMTSVRTNQRTPEGPEAPTTEVILSCRRMSKPPAALTGSALEPYPSRLPTLAVGAPRRI